MEDERDSVDIPRSAGSDPSGSGSGFELSGKLRKRMEMLKDKRIHPSSIGASADTRQFHGGHATVSKGLWEENVVAVKKSRMGDNKDPERLLGLALREAEFLVGLSHPNIVKLKGFVEDLSKDIIWLVFPWANNGNLKDFVASRVWEIPERFSLIKDVAGGLEYLHRQESPICHGDLKSLNILVNSEYRAVIIDFGSARRLTEHDLNRQPPPLQTQQQLLQATLSTLTKTITLTGNIYTLRWAAPELLGDDQMTLGSDMWALGWIAYEVLTNSIPFQDVLVDTVVVERVIQGDLPSINELARVLLLQNLCTLMTRCWNIDPSERPTAKEYLHVIRNLPIVIPNDTYTADSRKYSSRILMERGKMEQRSRSEMALACFTEALRISTEIGDMEGKTDALNHIALQSRIGIGDGEDRTDVLWGLADIPWLGGTNMATTIFYSRILQNYTRIGDKQGEATTLLSLAELHWSQNPYFDDTFPSDAVGFASDALQIYTDIGDMRGKANCLSRLATSRRFLKEYSEAVRLYSEALQIYADVGDLRGKASTLSGLATVHRLMNEYDEAVGLYSEALKIYADVGDLRGKANTLSGLATVHQFTKKYNEAVTFYSEAVQMYKDIGDMRGKANALSRLAEAHPEEYGRAVRLHSEALQIYTDIGDLRGKANSLSRLAEAHRLQCEYSEAVTFYSEAVQMYKDIGDMRGKANALSRFAEAHPKKYGRAARLHSEALRIYSDIRDLRGEANSLPRHATVHRLLEEYSKVVRLYSEALQTYTDIKDLQ